jgi:SAM-dependent methyltransferase
VSLRERRLLFRSLLPTARKVQIARSLAALKFESAGSVLVIGAGEDPYRQSFPQAQLYVTVDIDECGGITDVVADAVRLPFLPHSFEYVLATEVLEYISNPPALIEEIYRVLLPKGTAILTVPFMFNYHNDFWRPTKRGLQSLFGRFTDLSILSQGNRLYTIWDLITTSFWPLPILAPLRICSLLLYLIPRSWISGNSATSAPTGFFVTARKPAD